MTSQIEASESNNPPAESPNPPKSKAEVVEFEPPAACIRRLLKNALPKSTNISKDSCAAITRSCGIFVLYLTSCANDLAREGRRTTVSAKDVLGALQELDFEEFMPQLEKFLEQHRSSEKSKKEEKERLKATAAKKVDEANSVAPEINDGGSNAEVDAAAKDREDAVVETEASEKEQTRDDDGETGSSAKKQKLYN